MILNKIFPFPNSKYYVVSNQFDICLRLNGSSSVSETYGNPCLAYSEDFEVKEVEVCRKLLPILLYYHL